MSSCRRRRSTRRAYNARIMSPDEPLKSAYELAMEKLKARDRDRGVAEDAALTARQKDRIAEIRTQTKAKLAELEILWNSRRPALMADPEGFETAQREYVAERARVEERAESQIASIRDGK